MAFINCPECNQSISEKAKVCVHCGYPVVEERPRRAERMVETVMPKLPTYRLRKQDDKNSMAGNILLTMACITVVAGIICASVLAFATDGRGNTTFQLGIFLGILIGAGLYAVLLYSLGVLAEEIHSTNYMLQSLELVKEENSSTKTTTQTAGTAAHTRNTTRPGGKINCPHCGALNQAGKLFCERCGKGMV